MTPSQNKTIEYIRDYINKVFGSKGFVLEQEEITIKPSGNVHMWITAYNPSHPETKQWLIFIGKHGGMSAFKSTSGKSMVRGQHVFYTSF